ncbi:MAG: hypothetical protein IKW96_01450 [Ruminococcus sp.]|uniref:DUF7577 domain-containing protein n=1 Tax=Ruminococcus sp. TaxID=41978 RepID=UPI0025D344B4|nr:hypothetical protein [Ruminococcus sp.]MBR5681932.1 hypothetical protein [Ruminococcus sp.]
MKCPQCGTNNEAGFRFCVKCGVNLEDPQDINIEQLDMGGYHSEDDPATGGFTLGSGTFTISDTSSRDSSSDLYTAAELNDSDEEFDFSSFDDIDEPFIPKLDTGRVTLPEQSKAVRQAQMQNAAGGFRPQGVMQGIPAPQGAMQGIPAPQGAMQGIPAPQGAMQGIPAPQGAMQGIPAPQGAMQGIPAPQGAQQMGGMPVYGQPVMLAQPQLIGYDQNGQPLFGQPVMYQPQLIGYDQNGMPVYGQPVMYQPQIIGYDQNGMPVYGQPVMYQPQMGELPEGAAPQAGMQAVPNMGGIPANQFAQSQPVPPPVEDKEKVEVPDDFWEFFDGGKATEHAEMDTDDFFGKRGDEIDGMKRFEKKGNPYMNDTPLVDASALKKNESAKFNKFYMKSADTVNADDLKANQESLRFNYMGSTKNVDASNLLANERGRARNMMGGTMQANADELEAAKANPRRGSMMAQADKAVQAMPKKAKTYNDEIDAIELPEEMKAKKTARNTVEIPGLPEI